MSAAPVYSTRFKIVAALVVALAAGAFTLAIRGVSSDDGEGIVRSGGTEDFVERLLPDRDSQVPQQTPVGIDLVTGWDAALVINDVEIPDDQLDVTPELGLVQFVPGEGRAVERLAGGSNCVTAIAWPLSEGRDTGARTVRWCFEVA